jgi:hypothetical protein
MNHTAKLFTESLTPKEKLSGNELLSSDVERAITCNIIQKGATAFEANRAAKDLIQYCKAHNAIPSKLIAAELKKINPHLQEETLHFDCRQLDGDTWWIKRENKIHGSCKKNP